MHHGGRPVLGEMSLTRSGEICIHTYTAPEDGWCVNSHIVESETALVVVDAQYMLRYAHEVTAYAAGLGKPIRRLYLTHFHPDHILGASAFSCPIYSLGAVAAKIAAVGDRVAGEEHQKHGDVIAARAERPDQIVAVGVQTLDGIRFEFLHLEHAETADALMVGLPEQGILITQDLLYNGVHVLSANAPSTVGPPHCKAHRRLTTTLYCRGMARQAGPNCTERCCSISKL